LQLPDEQQQRKRSRAKERVARQKRNRQARTPEQIPALATQLRSDAHIAAQRKRRAEDQLRLAAKSSKHNP
jgi:hypothetical protein